jgi:phytoene desaturase
MSRLEDRIIIIGAGIGGLSAAICLAVAGKRVVIFEKNKITGGKMGEWSQDGFRWDTGPSVITMGHVFEDLFRLAGRRLEDYLTLLPVEPLTRYFYPDGVILDATRDLPRMLAQIERIEPRDVEGYLSYLAYAARIHRITGPVFIYDHPPRPRSFLRVPVTEWAAADPFRTMDQSIRRFVRSPHLRQLLGRFATYVGGSPYEAPATLNVIAHVELSGGVWYPKGGIYAIARALTHLAEQLGVEIHTSCPVQSIGVANGRVTGVELADGEIVAAPVIIANVDVTTIYDQLLPGFPITRRRLDKLQAMPPSCSGLVMLWGVGPDSLESEGNVAAQQALSLAHHNIFFSADYSREFHQIFREGVPPDDPTIYVAITSKTDPQHAPVGHENWFVLVNVPAMNGRFDWSKDAPAYRRRIFDKLGRYGLDVESRIVSERMLTPVDLAGESGAWRGALYGASANSKWTVFRRPHNRSSDIQGLYFTGGTTHPGGGVPMVVLSGGVAAELVLEDLTR